MLKTDYKVEGIPHSEYPRPQLQRDSFICLNGLWSFAKVKRQEKAVQLSSKILVPFSPETLNSGIDEEFVLERGSKMRYFRTVTLDKSLLRARPR